MTRILIPVLAFLLASPCALQASSHQNDWLVVPGERVGPIAANTTRADLNKLFGIVNLRDQPVDTGEGPESATVIFPSDRSSSLAVLWQDQRVDRVLICYQPATHTCKWHTKNGITLGTTLATLERLNQTPFAIEPWSSDVGGNISSWNGGKLAETLGEGAHRSLLVSLGYAHPANAKQTRLAEQVDQLGPHTTSSDQQVRELNPVVDRLLVQFGGSTPTRASR